VDGCDKTRADNGDDRGTGKGGARNHGGRVSDGSARRAGRRR
jgi:hypothetical protein